jgi:tetratricopeptide (TPR) repeat protein
MLCRNNKEYQQAYLFCEKALEIPYPKDLLFIEKAVYEYALLFEKSIVAYWVGKYQESYECCKKLIETPNVNESIKIVSRRNIQFSEQKLGKIITPIFTREDALENLRDIYTVCNKLNVPIFPFAGTLLGIIREGDFIAHDTDMDFAIKLEDYSSLLITELVGNRFQFEGSFGKLEKGYELRFIKRNIQIDIFFFYDNPNYNCTYYYDNYGKLYEVRYKKFELKEFMFKNIKIQIPNNPEEFLRQQYGDDWRTPKKTFNYLTDTKNITKES